MRAPSTSIAACFRRSPERVSGQVSGPHYIVYDPKDYGFGDAKGGPFLEGGGDKT